MGIETCSFSIEIKTDFVTQIHELLFSAGFVQQASLDSWKTSSRMLGLLQLCPQWKASAFLLQRAVRPLG